MSKRRTPKEEPWRKHVSQFQGVQKCQQTNENILYKLLLTSGKYHSTVMRHSWKKSWFCYCTWGKKAHADFFVCCFTDLQQHVCIIGGDLLDLTQSSSCVISSSDRYLPPVCVCCMFGSFVAYRKSSTFKLKSISFAWWFMDCKTRQRTYCKMYLNIYWTYTWHIFHICHLTSQGV